MQIIKIESQFTCKDCGGTAQYEIEYLMTANTVYVCESCLIEVSKRSKRLEDLELRILQGMKI